MLMYCRCTIDTDNDTGIILKSFIMKYKVLTQYTHFYKVQLFDSVTSDIRIGFCVK